MTTAREPLYTALMVGGVTGRGHSPDRSEKASALIEAFRGQVLAEAAEHLERIADETEAQVVAHFGPASGIGPGSADMVREAARSVRSLSARTVQDRPCGCSARFTRHADGCPTLTALEG